MITYIDTIGIYYQNYQVYAHSDAYEDIEWGAQTPISKADLDLKIIDYHRQAHIEKLSAACQTAITGGFVSIALGDPYIYDSQQEDQINLLGSVSTTSPTTENPNGTSQYYACRNPETDVKDYLLHTHAQLRMVMDDGADFKLPEQILLLLYHKLKLLFGKLLACDGQHDR
jgi:hypothetical protein